MKFEPLVSVVTPVYNGEPFLGECIESVLAQDYANWEYIIVNNCSTDRSLEVAEHYAARDSRIRVVRNQKFVSCIENHNNAFRQISSQSAYCKVVSADDRLVPEAIGKMVQFAINHPTVGIVGSYQQSNDVIKWKGIPENVAVLSGKEVCRVALLHEIHVFGTPTSVLYRADLVRKNASFFPHSEPHADTSACYEYLRQCDFGFIHEVLSVERVHEGQVTAGVSRINAGTLAHIEIMNQYGPLYLSTADFARRRKQLLDRYYRLLGGCVLKMKGRDFWEFHKSKLAKMGHSLDRRRVLIEAMREFVTEIRSPVIAFRKFKSAVSEKGRS